MKNLPNGRYQLLVMARRKNAYGSRVFDFSIGTVEEEDDQLSLSLSHKSNATNSTVSVAMTVGNAGSVPGSEVSLMCSVAGKPFEPCTLKNEISLSPPSPPSITHYLCIFTRSGLLPNCISLSLLLGSSPHYLRASEIPEDIGGAVFIAIALSSDRRPAIKIATIQRPVLPTGKCCSIVGRYWRQSNS